MVGIGVVGAGYWGPNLIRNFAALGAVELVAIADRDSERLGRVAAQYPGVATVERIEDLLANERIRGIALATPADTHFALARAVLAAGKGVFVEKPLARCVAECEELIAIAAAKGQVLMVGHTF